MKSYTLESKLDFGKHRGMKVKEVIDNYSQYTIWALENKIFTLDHDSFLYLAKRLHTILKHEYVWLDNYDQLSVQEIY